MTTPDTNDYASQAGDRNLPVPDPTRLTTALVDRALASFREVVETRLNGMDQATKLVAADVARISAVSEGATTHLRDDVDRQLAALREYVLTQVDRVADVSSEKFASIDVRFAERDERVRQAAIESKVSLDAALAAQSAIAAQQNQANATASNKQEVAFQKQFDQQGATHTAEIRALDTRTSELKERLDRLPGELAVMTKTDRRSDYGQVMLAISIVIAALAVVVAIAFKG